MEGNSGNQVIFRKFVILFSSGGEGLHVVLDYLC